MEKRYLPELITSSRIKLKKHTVDLAQKMFDYVEEDKERLSRFLPWPPFIKTVQDEIDFIKGRLESWEQHQSSDYGIYRLEDDEYMGNIGSFSYNWENESCEIGYWILGKFEGKGYMSEAVSALEQALFEAGFNRIVIRFDPENNKSGSIPRRLGYLHDGVLREAIKVNGSFHNLEVYSKLKSDKK